MDGSLIQFVYIQIVFSHELIKLFINFFMFNFDFGFCTVFSFMCFKLIYSKLLSLHI